MTSVADRYSLAPVADTGVASAARTLHDAKGGGHRTVGDCRTEDTVALTVSGERVLSGFSSVDGSATSRLTPRLSQVCVHSLPQSDFITDGGTPHVDRLISLHGVVQGSAHDCYGSGDDGPLSQLDATPSPTLGPFGALLSHIGKIIATDYALLRQV